MKTQRNKVSRKQSIRTSTGDIFLSPFKTALRNSCLKQNQSHCIVGTTAQRTEGENVDVLLYGSDSLRGGAQGRWKGDDVSATLEQPWKQGRKKEQQRSQQRR